MTPYHISTLTSSPHRSYPTLLGHLSRPHGDPLYESGYTCSRGVCHRHHGIHQILPRTKDRRRRINEKETFFFMSTVGHHEEHSIQSIGFDLGECDTCQLPRSLESITPNFNRQASGLTVFSVTYMSSSFFLHQLIYNQNRNKNKNISFTLERF